MRRWSARRTDSNLRGYYLRANLLQHWGQTDPESAAKHIFAHPERIPADLIKFTFAPFAIKHPDRAADWVQTFPAGRHRDVAIRMVTEVLVESDTEAALELAEKIGDEKERTETKWDVRQYDLSAFPRS